VTEWLVDTSALVRLSSSPDAGEWAERVASRLVRIAVVTRLEVGYAARSGADLRHMTGRPPLASMPPEFQTPAVERRALEVQMLLADQGQHRALSVPSLIVAATSELEGLTVLHADKHFELIADLTGQPVERLREPPA
jgi:predicted nucleic acid-binding protein